MVCKALLFLIKIIAILAWYLFFRFCLYFTCFYFLCPHKTCGSYCCDPPLTEEKLRLKRLSDMPKATWLVSVAATLGARGPAFRVLSDLLSQQPICWGWKPQTYHLEFLHHFQKNSSHTNSCLNWKGVFEIPLSSPHLSRSGPWDPSESGDFTWAQVFYSQHRSFAAQKGFCPYHFSSSGWGQEPEWY